MKFYNYIFVDLRKPGNFEYKNLNFCLLYQPFYVGKGTRNRWKHHAYNKSNNYKDKLLNKLLKIYKLSDLVIIFNHTNIEEISYHKEISLIEEIGKVVDSTGVLTNILDGGDGMSSEYMKIHNPMNNITSEQHSKRVKETQWSGEKGRLRKEEITRTKSGENSHMSKQYLFINSDGTQITFKGLKKFCKKNNYRYGLLWRWIDKGPIVRKSKKDTSFFWSSEKRKLQNCEIKEIK